MKAIIWIGLLLVLFPFNSWSQSTFEECRSMERNKDYVGSFYCYNGVRYIERDRAAECTQSMTRITKMLQDSITTVEKSFKAFSEWINHFYFFEDSYALSYDLKANKFGFIHKSGRNVIRPVLEYATNFNPKTRYAHIIQVQKNHPPIGGDIPYFMWLNPDTNNKEIQEPSSPSTDRIVLTDFDKNYKSNFLIDSIEFLKSRNADLFKYMRMFNQGEYTNAILSLDADLIEGVHQGSRSDVLAVKEEFRNKMDQILSTLNMVTSNMANARKYLYFYNNNIALGQADDGSFHFIDRATKIHEHLGSWDEAMEFNRLGYARVVMDNKKYLLNPDGKRFPLAESIQELNDSTLAYDNRQFPLDSFPEELLEHPQLQVILLNGIPQRVNQIGSIPVALTGFDSLHTLSLQYCNLKTLPVELFQMQSLRYLDLEQNQLRALPSEGVNLDSLELLNLNHNLLTHVPSEFFVSNDQMLLSLWFNPLEMNEDELNGNRSARESLNIGRDFPYASIFYDNRKYEAAHDYIKRATTNGTSDLNMWLMRSHFGLLVNDPDDVIFSVNTINQVDPNRHLAKPYLILAYILKDQWEENAKPLLDALPVNLARNMSSKGYLRALLIELQQAGIEHQDFGKVRQFTIND